MLIQSRAEAAKVYAKLAPAVPVEVLIKLSPLLCRDVVGPLWRHAGEHSKLPTAKDVEHIRGLELGNALPDRLLAELQLSDYCIVSPNATRRRLLAEALDNLANLGAGAAHCVRECLSCVWWVRPKPGCGTNLLSTSFYELPHGAFFGDLALVRVAPGITFDKASEVALQDNLYHEALHQQLIVTQRRSEMLLPDALGEGGARLFVPWRQTTWSLEHALQAAHVYAHLAGSRAEQLRVHHERWGGVLSEAHAAARSSAEYLLLRLQENSTHFTAAGRLFLDYLASRLLGHISSTNLPS